MSLDDQEEPDNEEEKSKDSQQLRTGKDETQRSRDASRLAKAVGGVQCVG